MKKLFLFAALIMTGFAFYSCEDVVDNPAQDPAQSWKYSVSVKFADFDLSNAPGSLTYQAPKTLYVFNEDQKLMGTISTDVAPTAGNNGTYAGTLTGAIGNNLIIATKTGADLAKQDGTIESAIENGIVQMDTVPIKIYNANSGTLTTASAKLQNKTAIVQFLLGGLANPKDKKVTFSTDSLDIPGVTEKSFTVTLKEDLDATANWCYFTLGTNAKDPIEIKAEIDAADRGLILASEKENITLNYGTINNLWNFNMQASQVDLTKYWAAYKEANPTATYCDFYVELSKTCITQSGSEYVPINLYCYAPEFTLKNVNTKSIGAYWPNKNKTAMTLEGQNIINNEGNTGLSISGTELTITGTGSLDVTGNHYGIYAYNSSWTDAEDPSKTDYTKLIIDENANVTANAATYQGIHMDYNSTLEVKDAATLLAKGEGGGISANNATLDIGKANVEATATGEGYDKYAIRLTNSKFTVGEGKITAKGGKNGNGIESNNATWDIKDGAKIYAIGGKAGRGINMYGDGTKTIKIGKNVTIEAQGAPNINEDALGWGMSISNPGDVTIGEGTTIKATGADRYGLYIGYVNIAIAEGATIEAIDALSNALETDGATITGKGKLLANQAGKIGIAINSGTLTLNGASIEATGGAGKAGIQVNGALAIGTDVISVKATAGTGAKCIADGNGDEVEIDALVADKTKFNDATADGVRTITPKPAAE